MPFPLICCRRVKETRHRWRGHEGLRVCRRKASLCWALSKWRSRRVDPSFSTFLGVHNGLAMGSIYIDGSEEQEAENGCRPMARFDKVGCFRSNRTVGRFPARLGGLLTTAKRDGDTWILNGEKRWIGNAALVRHLSHLGTGCRRQPGQRIHCREQDHAPALAWTRLRTKFALKGRAETAISR